MTHDETMVKYEKALKKVLPKEVKDTDPVLVEFFDRTKQLFEHVGFIQIIYGNSMEQAIDMIGEILQETATQEKVR